MRTKLEKLQRSAQRQVKLAARIASEALDDAFDSLDYARDVDYSELDALVTRDMREVAH